MQAPAAGVGGSPQQCWRKVLGGNQADQDIPGPSLLGTFREAISAVGSED